uniref:Uncharacterized protein n=1 Tax=Rhodosorus marinus TaxID=101924 RepID=A0A7S3A0C2_9RHOD
MIAMDLSLESVSDLLRKLEPVFQSMCEDGNKLETLPGGLLTKSNCDVILKVWGEMGPEFLEQVKSSPTVALPIILNRLREKEQEWQKTKSSYMQAWQVELRRLFDGFLDHRGTLFLEHEKEKFSTNELLQTIKSKSFISLPCTSDKRICGEANRVLKTSLELELEDQDRRTTIYSRYEDFVNTYLTLDCGVPSSTEKTSPKDHLSFYATEELYMLVRFLQALRQKVHKTWLLAGNASRRARLLQQDTSETSQEKLFERSMDLLFNLLGANLKTGEYRTELRRVLGPNCYEVFSTSWLIKRCLKLVIRIFAKSSSESMKLVQCSNERDLTNMSDYTSLLREAGVQDETSYRVDLVNEYVEIVALSRDLPFPDDFDKSRSKLSSQIKKQGNKQVSWPSSFTLCNSLDWSLGDDWRIVFVEGSEDAMWRKDASAAAKATVSNLSGNALTGLKRLFAVEEQAAPAAAVAH